MPSLQPRAKTCYLVIHNSASDRNKTTIEVITKWHQERGFVTCGYHFVIYADGSLHVGRPAETLGAHAEGFNHWSIGICLTGNFDLDKVDASKDAAGKFKDPQLRALVQLCAQLCNRYGIPANQIIGHCDVYGFLGQPQAKTCPGRNVYELMHEIRVQVAAYTPDQADDKQPDPKLPRKAKV